MNISLISSKQTSFGITPPKISSVPRPSQYQPGNKRALLGNPAFQRWLAESDELVEGALRDADLPLRDAGIHIARGDELDALNVARRVVRRLRSRT